MQFLQTEPGAEPVILEAVFPASRTLKNGPDRVKTPVPRLAAQRSNPIDGGGAQASTNPCQNLHGSEPFPSVPVLPLWVYHRISSADSSGPPLYFGSC